MTTRTFNKIIAVSGMAVIIGTGVVLFKMSSHSTAMVAQTVHRPAPSAPVPSPIAPTPEVAAGADRISDVDSRGSGPAVPTLDEPKPKRAAIRHATNAPPRSSASNVTAPGAEPGADLGKGSSGDAAVIRDAGTQPTEASTTVAADASLPAAEGSAIAAGDFTASDGRITTDVRAAIAGDGTREDVTIGVTTTDGVVTLTGILGSLEAIERVRGVAAKVKDVKRVDTSTLVIASL